MALAQYVEILPNISSYRTTSSLIACFQRIPRKLLTLSHTLAFNKSFFTNCFINKIMRRHVTCKECASVNKLTYLYFLSRLITLDFSSYILRVGILQYRFNFQQYSKRRTGKSPKDNLGWDTTYRRKADKRIQKDGQVDVTRRDIFASAEILVERVRVQPAKKHTRTTEYDFNYDLIRARKRSLIQRKGGGGRGEELHGISCKFEKARSTFRFGIMPSL